MKKILLYGLLSITATLCAFAIPSYTYAQTPSLALTNFTQLTSSTNANGSPITPAEIQNAQNELGGTSPSYTSGSYLLGHGTTADSNGDVFVNVGGNYIDSRDYYGLNSQLTNQNLSSPTDPAVGYQTVTLPGTGNSTYIEYQGIDASGKSTGEQLEVQVDSNTGKLINNEGVISTSNAKGPAANQALNDTECSGTLFSAFKMWDPHCMLLSFSDILLAPAAFLLWVSGGLLNISIQYSIIDIAAFANINGISTAWGLIRDLCNLIFIAVLIYIAVVTVIGKGDWKKTLANIIVAALLINFSMFFTKVLIDASNILTLQFYNAIPGITDPNLGIAGEIMKDSSLTAVYNPASAQATLNSASTSAATSAAFSGGSTDSTINFIVGIFMGSLLMLITSFVFLAGGILFIARLIILLILLVLSPIAFIGGILPKLKGMAADKWWSALTDQLLFAPVFMLLIWLSISILSQITQAAQSFGNSAGAPGTIITLVNYCIIIGFMLASIIIAKMLGAKGADFAQKWAGKATFGTAGWLGRNTIGRAATGTANSEIYKNTVGRIPILGKVGRAALEGTAKSSFDVRTPLKGLGANVGSAGGKGGYTAEEKKRREIDEKYGEYLGEGAGGEDRVKRYTNNIRGSLLSRIYLGRDKDGKGTNQSLAGKIQDKWDKSNIKTLQAQLKKIKSDNPSVREDVGDDEELTGVQKEYTEKKKRLEKAKEGKKHDDNKKDIADAVKEANDKNKSDGDGEGTKPDNKPKDGGDSH